FASPWKSSIVSTLAFQSIYSRVALTIPPVVTPKVIPSSVKPWIAARYSMNETVKEWIAKADMDPVTLHVIHNFLICTCREVGLARMRTSYSPMFNESLEWSRVIFNRQGRLISQAEFCPSQIGTIKFTVECVLEEIGKDAFRPGDVLLTNDPYHGCGH